MRWLALLLLLVAVPAEAKKVCLMGDSHMRGGRQDAGFGGKVSRWNTANTLTTHFPADTVQDWSIAATAPEDFIQAPGLASECVGTDDPWGCCTGAGTGSGCVCDGSTPDDYWWLADACDQRVSIVSLLPDDCDRWLILADGAVATTASAAVDDIETLAAQLDAKDLGDGVIVSSPPHFGTSGTCGLSTLGYDDVDTEMELRGDVINGPDFYALPEVNRCLDGIHPTDAAYAWMSAAWIPYMP